LQKTQRKLKHQKLQGAAAPTAQNNKSFTKFQDHFFPKENISSINFKNISDIRDIL